jgi:predicted nucleic acid-binding protein
MSVSFVDTNVLIRLLTGDDLKKQEASAALFTKVEEGNLTLHAPDTVIADAVFVLSSKRLYNLPRLKIAQLLTSLVRLTHFRVANRLVVLRALSLYGSSTIDFGDAMIVAAMQQYGSSTLFSFDTDFDGVKGISRLEPS